MVRTIWILEIVLFVVNFPQDFFLFLPNHGQSVKLFFFSFGFVISFANMLMLYLRGRIFLNLSISRSSQMVFFRVILGGCIFLLVIIYIPALLRINTALIWASAVTAVLIFVCAYLPNQSPCLYFFKLKTLADRSLCIVRLIQISMA